MNAKLINVIEVRTENGEFYFKLDGLQIGSFITHKPQPEPYREPTSSTQSAIIKSPSALDVKIKREMNEMSLSSEDIIQRTIKNENNK